MNYCDYCGNEPDECVCHLAPDFPDEPIPELDTDELDWEHYEEEDDEDYEGDGTEDFGEAETD